ncbi:MAG: hypothetical protein U1E21_11270 [Reyranellaceae bacterium]
MTNASTHDNKSAVHTSRDAMLGEIGTKWSKFSKQELSALKTNDELVTQVVAKYGIEKIAAQRDVDALLAGRKVAA